MKRTTLIPRWQFSPFSRSARLSRNGAPIRWRTSAWRANLAIRCSPKIRPTPDGGCYISWFDNDPTGHPPFGYDVDMQRLDANGGAQWASGGIRFADLG
jgi:hypothetical protein